MYLFGVSTHDILIFWCNDISALKDLKYLLLAFACRENFFSLTVFLNQLLMSTFQLWEWLFILIPLCYVSLEYCSRTAVATIWTATCRLMNTACVNNVKKARYVVDKNLSSQNTVESQLLFGAYGYHCKVGLIILPVMPVKLGNHRWLPTNSIRASSYHSLLFFQLYFLENNV
jgi:hypothetical protein